MTWMWLLAALLAAQHCGGPCEVPRGDDPVAGGKYSLTAGKEKDNWRYLFNWIWTDDGVPTYPVEGTLSRLGFGYRRMFASPAGNGFVVTGNAYTKSEAPPLLVFCDPQGNRLVEWTLPEDERTAGPCPDCDCKDVLWVFDEEARLSESGGYVEMRTKKRAIHFYLPLGAPVADRAAFERVLGGEGTDVGALIRALDDDDPGVRSRAIEELLAVGYAAFPALHDARPSEEIRRLLRHLKPREGYEALARDEALLERLAEFPEEPVARAARRRLAELRVDEVMAKRVKADGPGAAVLVMRGGETLLLKGYGRADIESKTPITGATVFELASVSKQFTATAVEILAERGSLALDDDARKVLPELPEFEAKRPIRIRDLLWHTSGLHDYLDLIEGEEWTNEGVLKRLAQEKLDFPTGTKFDYSNSNYLLLALIVERVSKQSFREFLAEAIFKPAGMRSATVFDDPKRRIGATGYKRQRREWVVSESALAVVGDGGVRVSLEDWVGWEGMLRKRPPPASGTLDDGTKTGYGFGWAVGDGVVDHSGGWMGASTYVVRDLKEELTVVVLSNNEGFPASAVAGRIAKRFLE